MEGNPEEPANIIQLTITKLAIFGMLKNSMHIEPTGMLQVLEDKLGEKTNSSFTIHQDCKGNLRKVFSKLKSKWKESKRTAGVFKIKHVKWLNTTVTIKNAAAHINTVAKNTYKKSEQSKGRGRPSEEFDKVSDRSKRRKTDNLREKFSTQELAFATQRSLRSSGAKEAASILKNITTKSPTRAAKYKAAFKTAVTTLPTEMSGDEALLDVVTAKLTKQQYKDIRSSLKSKNFCAYPSYEKVAEAKTRCYPSDIAVTETSAEVELQSLLNHTCSRILLAQNCVLSSLDPDIVRHFTCICKWGCDGSSGHSQYHQKFTDAELNSDKYVFLTSLVPLRIIGFDHRTSKELIIWKNPRPSSTRFCRPIRLQFLKESVESTIKEEQYVKNKIKTLTPYTTIYDGHKVIVNFELYFTMIDGKVCNSVTGTTSTMRCYLCNSTSKQFNNIELMKSVKVDVTKLSLGLSTLHAWIRFFECFLHIGYKKGIDKWQSRKGNEQEFVKKRKERIQERFKKELHLIVDQPKVGFGSSNDGNTARRFFENYSVSAKILEIDENLIKRFYTILQVMSCGFAINVTAFKTYCLETAELFVAKYSWYCMPTTVHKVLIHGYEILEWAPLPIGEMSEDAQEARNKDIKKYREHFARKSSRKANMENVFNRLLVTSDPYISSMSRKYPKCSKSLSGEALKLLHTCDTETSRGLNNAIKPSASASSDDDSE